MQIRLVWPGALSWPKALYYYNRYITAVVMIYANYGQQDDFSGGAEY
jgi:hypothetical protein